MGTPHSEHDANALLCLECGKPVLCEKPFTANAKQAAELFAKAEAEGLFLSEAMWTRFLPFLGTIRRVLDAGAIGKPELITANLGGDEVFDLGQGRSAGHDKAQLYIDHLSRMADIARRHGKRPEFWADMLLRHPESIPLAAKRLGDANWIVWGYEANDDLGGGVTTLKAAGLRTLVAPGTSSWRSFCGRTANMRENLRQAEAAGADGLLLVDWGDAGHWQPLAVSLPAIALAAGRTMDDLDRLVGVPGLGDFLLRLGDTYRTAKAEAGNSTLLFRAYNLPRTAAPVFDRTALQATLKELDALYKEGMALGDSLLAREARHALGLQRLAVHRALGESGLADERARLAREMEALWLERGPRAQLDASLHDFLEPDL